ncbi:MAG: 4'-phosphopantetheinyl transferase superfamily protein [Corynebacteriales bacterium]|nr:4'-phosphopantetheinyl transferase superfamily protein [Mycobacteriales bacterium]
MIADILSDDVVAVEAFGELPHTQLFPEEEKYIANAVDKRRDEFITVRGCARAALTSLGYPATVLVPGERGEPRWPANIVGSMTHCAGYRAAAVAHGAKVRGVGIDAEVHAPLPEGVLNAIGLPEELTHLHALNFGQHWDRLLFSAKESVYKAWFPLTGRRLGFADARIVLDPGGTFTATLLVAQPPVAVFHGRWIAREGLVLTAVTVPHD